jgi:uncharacterized protein YrrD
MNNRMNQEYEPFEENEDPRRFHRAEEPTPRRGSAQVFQVAGDEQSITLQSMKGRAVVSIQHGKKIGNVSDIVIDADKLEIAGLVLSKGTLFDRETMIIPAEQVQVWGQDVILVRQDDVSEGQIKIPEGKRWLYAEENLRGRYVVSVDGKRIGQINDISISPDGKLLAYELSQVFIDGPLAESKRINLSSTHSLGEDVLIVNSVKDL